MEYSDLEILATDAQVVKADGKKRVTFKVQVPGATQGPVDAEYDAVILKNLRDAVATGAAKWEDAMELGAFLADALLPQAVREIVRTRLVQAEAQKAGLRLRLMLVGNELNAIPWEFLLLNDGGGEAKQSDFLTLRPGVSIVRHPGTPLPPWKVAATRPAKLAVALASPDAQGLAPLDVAKEQATIEQAVAKVEKNGSIQVRYAKSAKVSDLPDSMHPAHLFHFAGHGTFDKTQAPEFGKWEGSGNIVLDDGTGDADYLSSGMLAVKLQDAGVRVAVLGACVSAQNDDVSMWASVALSLIKANVGAVVAMQYNVRDTSAIAFAEKFYAALLSGLTIDEAVSGGRVAVAATEDVRGFATPVLFLRAPDGIVFPEYKDDPKLAEERKQISVNVDLTIKTLKGKATAYKVGKWREGTANLKADLGDVEGEFVGFQADEVGGGSINVGQNIGTISGGGQVTGVRLDELGFGGG